MEEILRAKLAQHPRIQEKLLETKNKQIIENSPYDDFWGIGPENNGQNHLGKVWMKLRDELILNISISNSQVNKYHLQIFLPRLRKYS